jgi:hypothetical protein
MDEMPARVQHPGGTVEPASRAAVARAVARTLEDQMAARFELRDPFAEVTYRTRTFDEMVAKADHLGATRFNAIDEQGQRTPVVKVNGTWRAPETPQRAQPEATPSAKVVALTPASPAPANLQRIEADAERAALLARLQVALNERYIIKRASVALGQQPIAGHTEYRFRGDTSRVAFTETALKLSTDTNSPSVARSMVDVAETRNWQSLRVSGHDDFKRLVWLEATVRGVKAIGYEPVAGDLELLRKEREARQINCIEGSAPTTPTTKSSTRGSGTRKTVLAALDAVLVAQRVTEPKREAIMAAAAEQLNRRLANGEVHKVRVYDKSAPSRRSVTPTIPEPQRNREPSQVR